MASDLRMDLRSKDIDVNPGFGWLDGDMFGHLAIQVRAHFSDFADLRLVQFGLVFDDLELVGPLFGEFVQRLKFGFVCQLSDDGDFVRGQGVGFAAFFFGSGYGDDFGFD